MCIAFHLNYMAHYFVLYMLCVSHLGNVTVQTYDRDIHKLYTFLHRCVLCVCYVSFLEVGRVNRVSACSEPPYRIGNTLRLF